MKNKYIIISSLFLFLSIFISHVSSQTLEIGGVTYKVDTLEHHQVGPGTKYTFLELKASLRLHAYFLETDLTNPNIEIKSVLGRDSIYGGEQPSAMAKRKTKDGQFYFAGTNGDFYSTTGYIGYPVSACFVESQVAKNPGSRNVIAIDKNNIPEIGIMTYNGNISTPYGERAINTINHLRGENQLVLFNQLNGKITRTNQYGTEILVKLKDDEFWAVNKTIKTKILKIEKGIGGMIIPEDHAVLSGHGTAADYLNQLTEGDEVEISLNYTLNDTNQGDFAQVIGGDNYKTMLLNGVVETESVWAERHPRTGVGYSQNRDKMYFCVVDGRGNSAGVTTKELAELMKSAGAYTAFNMDGGGSSCMYIHEYNGPVNKTSDGTERAVSNGLFIVSNAPTDNEISEIQAYNKFISLPQYGEYTPKFYAYNQYGVLLNSDLDNVVLSCPSSVGKIIGNKFIASGTESGYITATYNNNITSQIYVQFIPVSDIFIKLDSVLIDNRKTYPIEVLTSTSSGLLPISPEALSWTVDNEEICTVKNGVVEALKNGTTTVYGEINDVKDQIKITVEIPEKETLTADVFEASEWNVSSASQLKVSLNTENRPSAWEHGSVANFEFKAGRAPFIKLTKDLKLYGLPDTVKIRLNVGEVSISRAIVSFRANANTKLNSIEFNDLPLNVEHEIEIPLDQVFDVTDKSIYPISLDNIHFYLNTSHTVGKQYSIALKEITLVYRDFISTDLPIVKNQSFVLFPNPVNSGESIHVQLEQIFTESLKTEIYSLTGQLVQTNDFTTKNSLLSIPIGNLQSGIYFLKVNSGNSSDTVKFVVK